MEWIGVIGIVAGLVFFVIAAMRGWNVLITSIVTAIIIALTNGMDIMNTMVGPKHPTPPAWPASSAAT